MATSELRKTGISSIGDLPWGTHFCMFYETQQDLLDTLIPFFRAGLENREFCLWVVRPPLTEVTARSAFQAAMPDLDPQLIAKSIEILEWEGWYLENGVFK